MLRFLVLIAACGPVRPVEGPALPPVPEPAPPQIAAPSADGCVDPTEDVEAAPVWRDVERYTEAWRARATASRGWIELPPPHQAGTRDDRKGVWVDDVLAREVRPDLLLDARGQLWLRTRLRYQCSRDNARFYIDRDGGVFEIELAPTCGEIRKVNLCGGYAAGGCGHDPGPQDPSRMAEWHYAPVPHGAHWLGIAKPVVIRDPMPVCYELRPAITLTPP